MGNDDVTRFTLELPPDVLTALDEHINNTEKATEKLVGAKMRIGRSKAIEAILRKHLKLPSL